MSKQRPNTGYLGAAPESDLTTTKLCVSREWKYQDYCIHLPYNGYLVTKAIFALDEGYGFTPATFPHSHMLLIYSHASNNSKVMDCSTCQ